MIDRTTMILLLIMSIWVIALAATALECYNHNRDWRPLVASYKNNLKWVGWSMGISITMVIILFVGIYWSLKYVPKRLSRRNF